MDTVTFIAKSALSLGNRVVPLHILDWSSEHWNAVRQLMTAGFKDTDRAVPALEQQIRDLWGVKMVRATNLGRSALELALRALPKAAGREVIVPSFMCGVVGAAVVNSGFRPVFADVDCDFNLSFESVREATSDSTCAILVAHLAGGWCRDLPKIMDFARQQGIWVIEDACQAVGLSRQGVLAGSFGDVSILSFGAGKGLGGCGGGAVLTSNDAIIRALATISLPEGSHCESRRRAIATLWTSSARINQPAVSFLRLLSSLAISSPAMATALPHYTLTNMTSFDALIATIEIQRLNSTIESRKKVAQAIRPSSTVGVQLPPTSEHCYSKYWLHFFDSDGEVRAKSARKILTRRGIHLEDVYTPLHLRPPFREFRRVGLPVTERIPRSALGVPIGPHLRANEVTLIKTALELACSSLQTLTALQW